MNTAAQRLKPASLRPPNIEAQRRAHTSHVAAAELNEYLMSNRWSFFKVVRPEGCVMFLHLCMETEECKHALKKAEQRLQLYSTAWLLSVYILYFSLMIFLF